MKFHFGYPRYNDSPLVTPPTLPSTCRSLSGGELRKTADQGFGLGVGLSELVVARSEQDTSTGGYQYTVIFLEETEDVPQMLVGLDDNRIYISCCC